MEGELSYYKGLVGGTKKIYGLIESSDFVAFKGTKKDADFKEILRIPLEKDESEKTQTCTEVFPYGKELL
jgi:hypothetical protein